MRDTAGQERIRMITSVYYRDVQSVFVMYDLTDKDSFENCDDWLNEIRRYASEQCVISLVGCKCDRAAAGCCWRRQVSFEEEAALAARWTAELAEEGASGPWSLVRFTETSSPQNVGIEKAVVRRRYQKCAGHCQTQTERGSESGHINIHTN